MDDVYSLLVTIDYPDALTRSLSATPTCSAASPSAPEAT